MNATALLFKALSDPTRLRIMNLLATGELCVCELMAALHLPQSTVSRHIASLKTAGWVRSRRAGVWMHYRLAEDPPHSALLPILTTLLAALPASAQDKKSLHEIRTATVIDCS